MTGFSGPCSGRNNSIKMRRSISPESLNSKDIDHKNGKVFRLQRDQDNIIAIDYSPKELYTSSKFDVEIR